MVNVYRLKSSVSPQDEVDLDDVWVLKKALKRSGHYDEPQHGMTPYPDNGLFNAIKQFQIENSLRPDGIIKPGSKTESRMQKLLLVVAKFRCRICGAWHGALYSPAVCWQCWHKGFR